MASKKNIKKAIGVIEALGFPKAQQNDRSALTLLALLDLRPGKGWSEAGNPLVGITPIMDWISEHYSKKYAPNTRETIRRQTMHQFCDAGIVLYNPDDPNRPVNSPKAVYQVESEVLGLLRKYGTELWGEALREYLSLHQSLSESYARRRDMNCVPVRLSSGDRIDLTPGRHNELIRDIIEVFAPRFAPDSTLIYAGDTGDKWGFFDEKLLSSLGVDVAPHGKMPDVVLHYTAQNWLLLVESVTSHGPVDPKRHHELAEIFASSEVGLVYVTVFPDRLIMSHHIANIAWETEVWVADSPSHLIHFNGIRFLGPYLAEKKS